MVVNIEHFEPCAYMINRHIFFNIIETKYARKFRFRIGQCGCWRRDAVLFGRCEVFSRFFILKETIVPMDALSVLFICDNQIIPYFKPLRRLGGLLRSRFEIRSRHLGPHLAITMEPRRVKFGTLPTVANRCLYMRWGT